MKSIKPNFQNSRPGFTQTSVGLLTLAAVSLVALGELQARPDRGGRRDGGYHAYSPGVAGGGGVGAGVAPGIGVGGAAGVGRGAAGVGGGAAGTGPGVGRGAAGVGVAPGVGAPAAGAAVARREWVGPLPNGYYATVPAGFTTVYYNGYDTAYVNGVHYVPVMYQGVILYAVVP